MTFREIKGVPAVPIAASELSSCVKIQMPVLGSPSLISLMVSVDVSKAAMLKSLAVLIAYIC